MTLFIYEQGVKLIALGDGEMDYDNPKDFIKRIKYQELIHLFGVGTTIGQWCLLRISRVEEKDHEEEIEEEEVENMLVTIGVNSNSKERFIFN